jgi:outer membrane protein OmpA-like peptidoglycan-associated protein
MGEVGAGWGFGLGRIVLGPALRYHHIVQPGTGSDGSDAKIVLLGIEAAWSGRIELPDPPAPSLPPEPPPPPPPKDSDGDGIMDPDDRCPSEPEDKDGFEDEDGCPDNDNDRDGIADADDKCPLEAEVINGVDDTDGCPDEGIITMVDDRVVLEEEVLFKTDRARVSTRGRQALAAVVRLWQQHPEWERLDVEGHADERGPDAYNQWLSEERAARVRKALIELGLDAAKVTTKGFGKTRPRREGRDEESLRLNRRVELVVVRKRPQTETAPAAAPAGEAAPAPAGELTPAPVPPAEKEAP